MHQCAGLLLLANRGVLDDALAGGVADVHPISLVFICFHEVHDHVDNNLPVIVILPYLNVRVNAREHRDIIIRDAFDLGEQLLLALFSHLAVPDSQIECLLIRLHGGLLEHSAVVLHSIFQGHYRHGSTILLLHFKLIRLLRRITVLIPVILKIVVRSLPLLTYILFLTFIKANEPNSNDNNSTDQEIDDIITVVIFHCSIFAIFMV